MAIDKAAETKHSTKLNIDDLQIYLDSCLDKGVDTVELSFHLNEDETLKSINISGCDE